MTESESDQDESESEPEPGLASNNSSDTEVLHAARPQRDDAELATLPTGTERQEGEQTAPEPWEPQGPAWPVTVGSVVVVHEAGVVSVYEGADCTRAWTSSAAPFRVETESKTGTKLLQLEPPATAFATDGVQVAVGFEQGAAAADAADGPYGLVEPFDVECRNPERMAIDAEQRAWTSSGHVWRAGPKGTRRLGVSGVTAMCFADVVLVVGTVDGVVLSAHETGKPRVVGEVDGAVRAIFGGAGELWAATDDALFRVDLRANRLERDERVAKARSAVQSACGVHAAGELRVAWSERAAVLTEGEQVRAHVQYPDQTPPLVGAVVGRDGLLVVALRGGSVDAFDYATRSSFPGRTASRPQVVWGGRAAPTSQTVEAEPSVARGVVQAALAVAIGLFVIVMFYRSAM